MKDEIKITIKKVNNGYILKQGNSLWDLLELLGEVGSEHDVYLIKVLEEFDKGNFRYGLLNWHRRAGAIFALKNMWKTKKEMK